MLIRLLTVTHQTPAWIKMGYAEYAKRMPSACMLELIEIPAEKRRPHANLQRIADKESKKILAAIKPTHYVIALDIRGKLLSTEQLANKMEQWLQSGKKIDLLIGGPEGLSPQCIEKAHESWSLSPLTFPHFLVRVIVAEQIYRAYSIIKKHPYHR